ncbi:tellurite resistance/C4-dicarboxylate transporter family protein [Gordonia shandongensis]|uniref:tellurite resistance/C4-dicarboxylate transporter family protein n=1 Tax=Gordonia shandongensis TaxID=376351 RepID=UPI00041545E9|nr:tellurite resistance/C4-dicarboxylate transporter family protein [Gordonia shandongensis]
MNAVGRTLRALDPGSFSSVMATGIVSIAASLHRWHALSVGLLWLSVGLYGVLVVAQPVRAVLYPDAVAADMRVARKVFGMFTFVAATGVIGARVILDGHIAAAVVLLAVTAGSWVVSAYALPLRAFTARSGEPVLARVDGTWFLWVVATQSVAVLAAQVQARVLTGSDALALLAVFCWAVGVFLYMAVALLVATRLVIHRVTPADLNGAYWVAMGATAITVVAGASIAAMVDANLLRVVGSTVEAVSVFFWAFGTWLVPPLVFAGYWRHVHHRVPFRYELSLWAIVFPLGMYGVGSMQLGKVNDLPLLEQIARIEIWLALIAWSLTTAAWLTHGWVRRRDARAA